MTSLSPRLAALALRPSDQIILASQHGVRWSAPADNAPVVELAPRAPRGSIKALARRFLAGEFGSMSYADVAAAQKPRISDQSLKQTIWLVRTGYSNKSKRSKRRAA